MEEKSLQPGTAASSGSEEVMPPNTAGAEFSKDRMKYEDPFSPDPSRKGMLLSNQIDWFGQRGVLIEAGYDVEKLRPASYTLTIGPDYVDSAGHKKNLNKGDGFFYMEPNSIVFVSTAEVLNLPFYIAARFNLRVKWVYRGILLGTGPQVEPGFRGNLSCPLFNLTDRAIKIRLGDEFATIDFERTTDFAAGGKWEELRAGVQTMEALDKVEVNGETFLLFKQRPYPPLRHLPDHDIVSSLVQISDEVKRWRAIGVGIVIAFLSLALTLLNFQNNLYREQKATSDQLYRLDRDLANTRSQLDAPCSGKPLLPPKASDQKVAPLGIPETTAPNKNGGR